jgi:hypothetical protein
MADRPLYPTNPGYVIGFHGTDSESAKDLVEKGALFRMSAGPKEWLGSGIYFWQNDPVRALDWAVKMKKTNPTVIGAVIDLGFSLYLLEMRWMDFVREAHKSYQETTKAAKVSLLTNAGYNQRYLDCAVMQVAQQRAKDRYDRQFDTIVGPFTQGALLYETAMLCSFDHMQICVVNQNCIKGCFYERSIDPQMPVL